MPDTLGTLPVAKEVRQFFSPYFTGDESRQGPGIWIAGTVVPAMVRHLFLFHSATEALCFCHLHPEWLARPGSCVFAALGLLPQAAQVSELSGTYGNARLHTVFGNGLLANVLDCKAALWHKGRDAAFSFDRNGGVHWRWRGKPFVVPEPDFSLHRFQQLCGLRMAVRTHKPPAAYATFFDLLNQ